MKYFLKQPRVIDPARNVDEVTNIVITDGVIEAMGANIVPASDATVIDLKGKVVAPGFLDMHVHFREPGFEYKETIATGCASAAAGGFTGVCCMPNTNPAIDDPAVVRYISDRAKEALNGAVDVYSIAAVTKQRKGLELAPMLELAEAGAVGFSDDGAPVESAEVMRRALEYGSMTGLPVIQHAEEISMTKGGAMNEGLISTRLGLPSMPPVAEELVVSRDLALAKYVKAQYHVAHISTRGTVEMVRAAKAAGETVSCEVTPHHFTLTDAAVTGYDTNTKMNPPLRTAEDVAAIKEGLRDGTVDVIATDHAPHSYDEKQVEYAVAPFGIVGLETAIGLAITELVNPGIISAGQLIEKFSCNPRRILHLPEISIQKGAKANLTIIDCEREWNVIVDEFKSKSKNSPFGGRKLTGKAFGIFNNGVLILAD